MRPVQGPLGKGAARLERALCGFSDRIRGAPRDVNRGRWLRRAHHLCGPSSEVRHHGRAFADGAAGALEGSISRHLPRRSALVQRLGNNAVTTLALKSKTASTPDFRGQSPARRREPPPGTGCSGCGRQAAAFAARRVRNVSDHALRLLLRAAEAPGHLLRLGRCDFSGAAPFFGLQVLLLGRIPRTFQVPKQVRRRPSPRRRHGGGRHGPQRRQRGRAMRFGRSVRPRPLDLGRRRLAGGVQSKVDGGKRGSFEEGVRRSLEGYLRPGRSRIAPLLQGHALARERDSLASRRSQGAGQTFPTDEGVFTNGCRDARRRLLRRLRRGSIGLRQARQASQADCDCELWGLSRLRGRGCGAGGRAPSRFLCHGRMRRRQHLARVAPFQPARRRGRAGAVAGSDGQVDHFERGQAAAAAGVDEAVGDSCVQPPRLPRLALPADPNGRRRRRVLGDWRRGECRCFAGEVPPAPAPRPLRKRVLGRPRLRRRRVGHHAPARDAPAPRSAPGAPKTRRRQWVDHGRFGQGAAIPAPGGAAVFWRRAVVERRGVVWGGVERVARVARDEVLRQRLRLSVARVGVARFQVVRQLVRPGRSARPADVAAGRALVYVTAGRSVVPGRAVVPGRFVRIARPANAARAGPASVASAPGAFAAVAAAAGDAVAGAAGVVRSATQ
mmetsp:Transcript_23388/g.79000  ORF Transcript_23388/g.79000 Transcript_23388/m.79000 type:complete len:670 (-) Transcript_23388:185-2194(-)